MQDESLEQPLRWTAVVARKQQALQALLEPYALPPDSLPPATRLNVSGFFVVDGPGRDALTPLEHEMTSKPDGSQVLQKLQSREWKATDLLRAYIKR
jgi:hypothetical protein